MRVSATLKSVLLPIVIALAGCATANSPADTAAVAQTIKADVAQIVAGLNAHDPARATALDATDIVEMQCGSPPIMGADADRAGFADMFAHVPQWRASLISETVDVGHDGDLAVYRGVYNEDGASSGVLMTHRTNFIAEFKRQADGAWRMTWYVIANIERSHPK